MEEQLITFETAQLAKEKRFNWKVLYHCSEKGIGEEWKDGHKGRDVNFNNRWTYKCYSAPTQSLLQKWLREVHSIDVEPRLANQEFKKSYYFAIHKYIEYREQLHHTNIRYDSYEQALEYGLLEALKLI